MGYSHHGIYVRHNHVIQYRGGASGGKVEKEKSSQVRRVKDAIKIMLAGAPRWEWLQNS